MNRSRPSLTVNECKIQASLLLKALYSDDPEKAIQAAKRFKRLPEFSEYSLDKIVHLDIKLKHALNAIAISKGFKTWVDLKTQIPLVIGGFLNQWFADYAIAKSHLNAEGGFLLPYKNQFFICDAHYIKQLGFNPKDPDWKSIGYDWVNPKNPDAWKRLYKKWIKIQGDKP